MSVENSSHYTTPSDGIPPGGRLQQFINYWKTITTHRWPISVIEEGYRIQWISTPSPWYNNKSTSANLNDTVNTFLNSQIIERSPDQDSRFLSSLFAIQEQTKIRPVLDCKMVNQYIQCQHFKMEGVPALREIIQPNDWICKLDLKDAYVVVPIHKDSRRYLSFRHQGMIFNYKSLPFGMSVAPRVFSKLMRYAMTPLRKQGIRLVYYLDDICILARTKHEMNRHMDTVISHLQRLGFILNMVKSDTTPRKIQDFLGFTFNTSTMTISVPGKKMKKLGSKVRQAFKTQTCRWIAGLLGMITSMLPAIGDALLHIRYIQRDLAKALKQQHYNWERKCQLSGLALDELAWWISMADRKNGLKIKTLPHQTPIDTIYVDASGSGWGVKSKQLETWGHWSAAEKGTSINVRELKTILFAIQLHQQVYANQTIEIRSDNSTALKYVNKQGGTASPVLQALALEIRALTSENNIALQCHHIAGKQNVIADQLSRTKPAHEWTLPFTHLQHLCQIWKFQPTIDAFASRTNHRLTKYWSYRPDPTAAAMDAFKQQWPAKGLYLFPPWRLIPHVLQRIQQQQVKKAIMITPYWPMQHWWPMLMNQALKGPIAIHLTKNKILAAWLLSSKRTRNRV